MCKYVSLLFSQPLLVAESDLRHDRPRLRSRKAAQSRANLEQTRAQPFQQSHDIGDDLGDVESYVDDSHMRQNDILAIEGGDGGDGEPRSTRAMSSTAQQVESAPTTPPPLFIHHPVVLASPVELLEAVTSPAIDQFHNSSFLSRSAILGDEFPGLDHSHPDRPVHEFKVSDTDLKVLELHGAFELPPLAVRQSLFEAVLKRCWTWTPVLDLELDSNSRDAASPSSSTKATSLLLLQALMLVGSHLTRGQFTGISIPSHYRRVKAIIDSGVERDPLKLLAAVCLIQWCAPSAPKDISMDTPRFWNMYAISLAQQMGLHRKNVQPGENEGLRKRLWWSLYARDSLTASAHGRPRQIHLTDCTVERPTVFDFPDPADPRAQIFVTWVSICEILHDICHLLSTQHNPTGSQKQELATRLLHLTRSLPAELQIVNANGTSRPYNFELAQLHATLLTAITILYRPSSIYNILPMTSSAISIVASNLTLGIFEAIQLRNHTCYLSSAFTWYLLVAAIPQLSAHCCVPALATQSQRALDTIEKVLQDLSKVRSSAVNNLCNIRAIRKGVSMNNGHARREQGQFNDGLQDDETIMPFAPVELLAPYGQSVVDNYLATVDALQPRPFVVSTEMVLDRSRSSSQGEAGRGRDSAVGDSSSASFDPFPGSAGFQTAESDFALFFGDDFQERGWMRSWVDDLPFYT